MRDCVDAEQSLCVSDEDIQTQLLNLIQSGTITDQQQSGYTLDWKMCLVREVKLNEVIVEVEDGTPSA